jgi:hypothetical protein
MRDVVGKRNVLYALRIGGSTDVIGLAQLLEFIHFVYEGTLLSNNYVAKKLH